MAPQSEHMSIGKHQIIFIFRCVPESACHIEQLANCAPIESGYGDDEYGDVRSADDDYAYDEDACLCKPPTSVADLMKTLGLGEKFVCCYNMDTEFKSCEDGFK